MMDVEVNRANRRSGAVWFSFCVPFHRKGAPEFRSHHFETVVHCLFVFTLGNQHFYGFLNGGAKWISSIHSMEVWMSPSFHRPLTPNTHIFWLVSCRPSTKKGIGIYLEKPKPVFQKVPTRKRPGLWRGTAWCWRSPGPELHIPKVTNAWNGAVPGGCHGFW